MHRRNFLRYSGSALAAAQLVGCSNNAPEVRLYGGYRSYANTYGIACIDQSGNEIWKLPTPDRVHEVCLSEDLSLGAVVARRPGDFILLFDPATGLLIEQIKAPHGLIYEGHALFRTSNTGQLQLWATASPLQTSTSILLKYDLQNLARQPENISITGLGPHQMLLKESGQMVIAVGGWQSHGRTILNADTFESGLSFFDPEGGKESFVPVPNSRLSARHMDTQESELWVGMQLADPAPTEETLVYRYSSANGWLPAKAPKQGWQAFNGYIGSVAATTEEVVVTSPQGHVFSRWSPNGEAIQINNSLDIAAAVSIDNNWWLGSGLGEIYMNNKKISSGIFWDNHWIGHKV